ncbi:Eco57I restriction-modification methylase domain-containing protein [Candidatus Parcubacteria bacterium]|nr:Eco57I restriction-modification methylase domain-containing protein [Candidatus Parcubacteria bacterium]
MDKYEAKKLVADTFQNPFDKSKFSYFVKNLLNHFDESKAFHAHGYIKEKFKKTAGIVKTYERLGTYTDSKGNKVDILIVYLEKKNSLDRARTTLRNFVADYLKQRDMKEAALVAFVSPDFIDWRFSLVKVEYKILQTPLGNIKTKEDFTPAKRFSFLVGPEEHTHTAQSRLIPIIENDINNPTLEDLEDAFNVEKVTKEFFEKYRDLFIRTKGELDKAVAANQKTKVDFESKGIDTVNLAKKLLGQIIFLYYLQKKGWFGVPRNGKWGEGAKNFLRELFAKKKDNENFFNDILEHLFYDALRNDRSHDDHYYGRFNCKIPFLNGGLFDPMNNYDWVQTDILLPNSLFSNKNKTKEGDEGDGILDIFDRYNFTVKEDEPFEKEVAIDPELLGKAYEKFNAIRPDNYDEFKKTLKGGKKGEESKFNKQYGVYYTPREIVHYMCQQSLINYLYSELNSSVVYQKVGDENLDMLGNTTKDGQLDLTVEHHQIAEISKEAIALLIQHGESLQEHEAQVAEKETKTCLPIIPESIRRNAMRIDKKLAEIKICDPAVGSGAFPVGMMSEIVHAREVLKIWTKTEKTTYDFKRECIENSLYGVDIDAGAIEIAKLRLWLSLIVDEDNIKDIKPLPNLDYKIVCGNSLLGVEKNLFNLNLFTELEMLKPLYFNATNPTQKQECKKKIDSLIDQITNGHSQFDFEIYFSEVFHENGGFDVVIGNPPYEEISEKRSRDIFKKKYSGVLSGHYDLYIFFFRQAFHITRKGGVVTYITPHTYLQYPQFQKLRTWLYQNTHIVEISSRIEHLFESAVVDTSIVLLQNRPSGTKEITLFSDKNISSNALKSKNENRLQKNDFSDQAFDWETIQNFKKLGRFTVNTEKLGDILDSSQGITVYAKVQGKKIDYFRDKKEDKTCKPLTRGKEINKYTLKWDEIYIKYGDWLWCPRHPKFFESPKVLLRQTSDTLIGVYVEEPFYCIDSVHSLINKPDRTDVNLKYVLSILNSKLGAYFYTLLIQETHKVFAQVKLTFLRQFPVKIVSTEKQQSFIKLVDRILVAKRGNPRVDISKWECEIDQMVYKLYGLTPEEIEIVENQSM